MTSLSFKTSLFVLFVSCFFINTSHANESGKPIHKYAIELETHFWNLVKNHNVEEFSEKLSPIFQALGPDGVIPRDQQIISLSNATIDSFFLHNVIVTQHHNTIVISYFFSVAGTGLTAGPTLSVWKKDNHRWRMLSHSFTQPVIHIAPG